MLLHTSNTNSDDWRLWLTAAGLPADLSKQPGITFDMIFMTIQAAIDGIGVAMGRTSYVRDDIAKSRLVVPFKIALPADAGFYRSRRRAGATRQNLPPSAQWLVGSAQTKPLNSAIPCRQTPAAFCGLVRSPPCAKLSQMTGNCLGRRDFSRRPPVTRGTA